MTTKKVAAKKTTRAAGGGRKKDPLTERIVFRVLPEERALLESVANESGRSVAAEARFRLFKHKGSKL